MDTHTHTRVIALSSATAALNKNTKGQMKRVLFCDENFQSNEL